jgi:hypothetical protein
MLDGAAEALASGGTLEVFTTGALPLADGLALTTAALAVVAGSGALDESAGPDAIAVGTDGVLDVAVWALEAVANAVFPGLGPVPLTGAVLARAALPGCGAPISVLGALHPASKL